MIMGLKDASQENHSMILEHNHSINCATQLYADSCPILH